MKKFVKGLFCFLGAFVLGVGIAILPYINTYSSYASSSTLVYPDYDVHTFYTRTGSNRFGYLNSSNSYTYPNIQAVDIWSDGINYYYSGFSSDYGVPSVQFVFSRDFSFTLSAVNWTNDTNYRIGGRHVWTDGINIFCNYVKGTTNYSYIYNVGSFSWSTFTFNGLTNFYGWNVWTDGTNYYYSEGSSSYILDVNTSTWSTFTFNGIPTDVTFNGRQVWTDGTNYYFNSSLNTYILDVNTSTWSLHSFNVEVPFSGTSFNVLNMINVYGTLYYLDGYNAYIFDKVTNSWNLTLDFSFFGYPSESNLSNYVGQYFFVFDGFIYRQTASNLYFSIFPSYTYGYNLGYTAGYNAGYNDGYNDGSSSSGGADSYNQGYNQGYNAGYNAGVSTNSGYTAGYNTGYNSGYNVGYSAGSVAGYDTGYSEGNREGYNTGYNEGVEDSNEYTFLGLVGAVIDAPIQAFTNLFNFEVFGTNIKNLLLALFTASIIVVVVKFALGGK